MLVKIPDSSNITGVILAGGKGRRMGGQDKGLLPLNGKPLIEYVVQALSQQVSSLLINANRNTERYARYGYPVIDDELSGYQGPLAGFAAALEAIETDYIVTLPCDAPVVPPDLVERLGAALVQKDADIAVAHDGVRMQPVYALIPRLLRASLLEFLDTGERKIDRWYARHRVALADFSDAPDAFRNLNTPEQRASLEQSTPGYAGADG
jgi:molybdenum cofactor guanylyltransferase